MRRGNCQHDYEFNHELGSFDLCTDAQDMRIMFMARSHGYGLLWLSASEYGYAWFLGM